MLKKLIRKAYLRWHPDKILQRIGAALHDSSADAAAAIRARVNTTAHAINDLKARLLT